MSRSLQKRIWKQRARSQFPIDYKAFVSKSYLFDRTKSVTPEKYELFTEILIEEGRWLVLQIGQRRALWMDLVQFEDALNHVLDKYQRKEGATE